MVGGGDVRCAFYDNYLSRKGQIDEMEGSGKGRHRLGQSRVVIRDGREGECVAPDLLGVVEVSHSGELGAVLGEVGLVGDQARN